MAERPRTWGVKHSEVDGATKRETEPPVVVKAFALGQSFVQVQEEPIIHWRRTKSKELFFYLLCHPGWQHRERIVADIFEDKPQTAAISGFHSSSYQLRRGIHPTLLEEYESHYRLSPSVSYWFDAEEFERTSQDACAQTNPTTFTPLAQKALSLYHGPFLGDLSPEWAEPMRQRLEELYLELLVRLARHHETEGGYSQALQLAQQAVIVNPYLEPAHELIVQCQAATGQTTAALHHYRNYTELLRRELNEEPPAKLTSLLHRIRHGQHLPTTPAPSLPIPPKSMPVGKSHDSRVATNESPNCIPDALWQRIQLLFPPERPKPKGGRPRMPNRQTMEGILYVLRTGCKWKNIPTSLGAPSTIHDRFQEWRDAGVFQRLLEAGILESDHLRALKQATKQ